MRPSRARSLVTARDNYFMAAIHWGAAQWPIDENNEQNRFYNDKKRECYTKYAKVADHHVEAAWIPLPDGQSLPGWFHLPPDYRGGRIPVVISLPGMDSFKEMGVALNGDRWLSRGMAVLALDGPGQYESPVLGDLLQYGGLDRHRHSGGGLADGACRGRREPHRARRQQLRVVLRNHCRRPRAADSRRRGLRCLPRAWLPHDLRRGIARPSRCASCTCPASPTRPSSTSSARP